MRKAFVLALILLAFSSCASEGPVVYTGDLPPIVDVTYQDVDKNTIATRAYEGWVTIVWHEPTKTGVVQAAVDDFKGKVIDAVPAAGIYTVAVASGATSALIAALNEDMRVVEAAPTVEVVQAEVSVIDFPFDSSRPQVNVVCADFHGNLTNAQVAQGGRKSKLVSVRPTRKEQAASPSIPPRPATVGELVTRELGKGRVVNLSLQAYTALNGVAYRHAEGVFLASVFAAAESAPDGLVVVAAGNMGQDLTMYIRSLRKQFPEGGKRVVIVEAREESGARASFSNFATTSPTDATPLTVGAPGVGVPIDTTGVPLEEKIPGTGVKQVRCDGTSFAAPIVAGILDAMKERSPNSSVAEITEAFYNVTKATGGVPSDWFTGPPTTASNLIQRLFLALPTPAPTSASTQVRAATPTRTSSPGRTPTPTQSSTNTTGGAIAITATSCVFKKVDAFTEYYALSAEGTVSGPIGSWFEEALGDDPYSGEVRLGWTRRLSTYTFERDSKDPETTSWRIEAQGIGSAAKGVGMDGKPFSVKVKLILPNNKGTKSAEKTLSCQ